MAPIPRSASTVNRLRDGLFMLILVLLLGAIFKFNMATGGSIAGPRHLAEDLKSPSQTPQEWRLDRDLPARYRLLFKWTVQGTWRTLFHESGPGGFYGVYLFWSFIFYAAALLTFYLFLKKLEFGSGGALIGCLLFLSSAPVLMAYRFPVHTREDPLSYFLVLLGLFAVFGGRPAAVLAVSALGALARETTLLVPLVYLRVSPVGLSRKALVVLSPLVILGIAWAALGGFYLPNPLNNYNVRFARESAVFFFMVFGPLWAAMHWGWRSLRPRRRLLNRPMGVIVTTAPLAVGCVVGVSLAFARVREIRICFLAFPWVLPLAMAWFRSNAGVFGSLARSRGYRLYAACVLAVLAGGFLFLNRYCETFLATFRALRGTSWQLILAAQLFALVAVVLPLGLCASRADRD